MRVRTVAIVDPYDAGSMLAPAFAAHGVAAVMVGSTPEIPRGEAVSFDPATFTCLLPWCDNVDTTVAMLRGHGVGTVIAGSERGVILADRLSEVLGCPGNGTRLSDARRDKFRMLEEVGRRGIRVPRQIQSDSLDTLVAWVDATGHWPAVIKPRRSKGSDGVRLCASKEAAADAFHALHGRTDRLGCCNDTVLAQQFLRGREYVVDTVSRDGRHRLAALWAYGKPEPDFATVGLLATKQLLSPHGPLADTLFDFAVQVLDALEIRHGAGHCEVIIDQDGPALVEIGARLHGGPPAHLMCRAAIGTSQLDLLVQSCLDPTGFLDGVARRSEMDGGAAMALLRDTGLKGEIESLPSAQRVVWNARHDSAPAPVVGLATLIHPDPCVVAADLEIVIGTISCEIITRREAIAAVVPDWRLLLQRSRCNRAFGGPVWYLAALDVQPELSPLLLIAHRSGRLAGVLPLVWDGTHEIARFPTMLSDYNDLVVADGDMAAARRLMTAARTRFPGLELACVRADSDCARAASGAPSFADKRFICPFADLSSGYDRWLASRKPDFRRRLAQTLRRAERSGIRAGRFDPDCKGAIDPAGIFRELQRERFGESSLFLRDPTAQAFVERALPELVREDSAVLFGLWAEEQLIGLNICMTGADSLGYWNAGFLAAFAAFSPGTLMIEAGLRQACAMGLAEFDFLRGREAYKMNWCTGQREIGRLT